MYVSWKDDILNWCDVFCLLFKVFWTYLALRTSEKTALSSFVSILQMKSFKISSMRQSSKWRRYISNRITRLISLLLSQGSALFFFHLLLISINVWINMCVGGCTWFDACICLCIFGVDFEVEWSTSCAAWIVDFIHPFLVLYCILHFCLLTAGGAEEGGSEVV